MSPDDAAPDLVQIIFPPHVDVAVGYLTVAIVALVMLSLWLLIESLIEQERKKKR